MPRRPASLLVAPLMLLSARPQLAPAAAVPAPPRTRRQPPPNGTLDTPTPADTPSHPPARPAKPPAASVAEQRENDATIDVGLAWAFRKLEQNRPEATTRAYEPKIREWQVSGPSLLLPLLPLFPAPHTFAARRATPPLGTKSYAGLVPREALRPRPYTHPLRRLGQ